MIPAHYMKFVPGQHGQLDRIGGLPTHLPPEFPLSPNSGQQMAFLGQFYEHPERLPLDGALCIHLYQCLEDYDPWPVVVAVPKSAPLNLNQEGTPQPDVQPFDVEWEYREDPENFDHWQTDLCDSKAGGTCYFSFDLNPHDSLLLQLSEDPGGFNFGGYTPVIVRTSDGRLQVRLG